MSNPRDTLGWMPSSHPTPVFALYNLDAFAKSHSVNLGSTSSHLTSSYTFFFASQPSNNLASSSSFSKICDPPLHGVGFVILWKSPTLPSCLSLQPKRPAQQWLQKEPHWTLYRFLQEHLAWYSILLLQDHLLQQFFFEAMAPPTKQFTWNFSLHNVDFGFVSAHLFEACVEHVGGSFSVLSGVAQGCYAPYPGRWSWRAEGRTGWSEKWMEMSRQSEKHSAHEPWRRDDMWISADSNLSQCCAC